MKTIHLIRHAKSSWSQPQLDDINRPLNARGVRSCKAMAPAIVKAGCSFSPIFCSPAVRAQSTIELLNEALPSQALQWQISPDLYCFSSYELLRWFKGLDEGLSEVVVVGHNPALTDFCNEISQAGLDNIPTCGYVQLKSQSNVSWQQLQDVPFELTCFIKPKQLMKRHE